MQPAGNVDASGHCNDGHVPEFTCDALNDGIKTAASFERLAGRDGCDCGHSSSTKFSSDRRARAAMALAHG